MKLPHGHQDKQKMTYRTAKMRSSRRASGIVVFAAILLPAAIYGVAVTADHGRVLLASRQTSDVADSVVMAAASGISNISDQEEQAEARIRADEMFKRAETSGMLSEAISAEMKRSDITFNKASSTVTVVIHWKVGPLPLIKILFPHFNGIEGTVTRSNVICTAAGNTFCLGAVSTRN